MIQRKKESTKNYLLSIAEHLLQQNCPKQAFIKYKHIKSTLKKKQQNQTQLLQIQRSSQRLSSDKLTKLHMSSNTKQRPLTKDELLATTTSRTTLITKRQSTLSPTTKTNTTKYNKSSTLQKPKSKKSNNKVTNFSIDASKTIDFSERITSNQKKLRSNSNTIGRKLQQQPSPFRQMITKKKKLFDDNNNISDAAQKLIQSKIKGLQSGSLSNNKRSKQKIKKQTNSIIQSKYPQAINSNNNTVLVQSKKGSTINLNLNLNKLLRSIQQSIFNNERSQRNLNNILSQQNISLLKKINNKLSNTQQSPSLNNQMQRLSQGFKKHRKAANNIHSNNNKKNEVENKQNYQSSIFSFVQISTPTKQNPSQHQNYQTPSALKTLDLSNNNQTPNTEKDIYNKIKNQQILKQEKNTQIIQQLKTDNKWLVKNIENLLNQNQQLKAIIINKR